MKKLLKSMYVALPFKQQLYSLVKKLWSPPQAVYQHLYFTGILTIKIDDRRNFKMRHYGYSLENEIFWEGLQNGWEKHSINLWLKLCERSKVVLDIGANTGVYSLITKAVNPSAKVYAFEPVQSVYEKLEANTRLNGFDIACFPVALSNYNGAATVFLPVGAEHVYTVTVNNNILPKEIKTVPTEIKTWTLKSFVEEKKITHIDLIKIDVETHEPEVLEGFGEYLHLFKPTILVEVLSDELGEKVQGFAEKCGYLFFNIDERTGVRQVSKITRSDYYNYLLCSEETAKTLNLKH